MTLAQLRYAITVANSNSMNEAARTLFISQPSLSSAIKELEEEIGMTPVLWSLDSLDWKLKDTGKIIRQVLKDVKDGDIILLHDIFPSSVEAALELIDILQKEGYVFVTADELLIE